MRQVVHYYDKTIKTIQQASVTVFSTSADFEYPRRRRRHLWKNGYRSKLFKTPNNELLSPASDVF